MLKRSVSFIVFLLLLLCLSRVLADAYAPYEFDLRYIPKYGEGSFISGTVYSGGTPCTAEEDLAVKLFLQVEGSDTWWPKPYYEMPYVHVEWSDFSIPFNTGGNDLYATRIVLMLVREKDAGIVSFEEANAAALCVTTIGRSPDGKITLSHSSRSETAYLDRMGLDVGFFAKPDMTPASELPDTYIRTVLRAAAAYATDIRLYASSGETAKAYPIARDMGFRVAATAWLENTDQDQAELSSLIRLCNEGLAATAIVGNESVHSRRMNISQLLEDIALVRAGIINTDIPVTTAETPEVWLNNPELADACDVIAVNLYPFWNVQAGSIPPEAAGQDFRATLDALIEAAGGKPILITETGWPNDGAENAGNAEQLAAFLMAEDIRWEYYPQLLQIYWFSLADEAWKVSEEGPAGAHWGILDENLDIKPMVNDGFWAWSALNEFSTELPEDYFP